MLSLQSAKIRQRTVNRRVAQICRVTTSPPQQPPMFSKSLIVRTTSPNSRCPSWMSESLNLIPCIAVLPQEHLHFLNSDLFKKPLQDPKSIHKLKLTEPFSFAQPLLLFMTSGKAAKNAVEKAPIVQYLYSMIIMYRNASKARHNSIRYPDKESNLHLIPRQIVLGMLSEFTEVPANNKNSNVPLYAFLPHWQSGMVSLWLSDTISRKSSLIDSSTLSAF